MSSVKTGAEDDGTPRRRVRNPELTRQAIVDAALSAVEEGECTPTSRDIAERAGVSERSIFVHFRDLYDLRLAATHHWERMLPELPHRSPTNSSSSTPDGEDFRLRNDSEYGEGHCPTVGAPFTGTAEGLRSPGSRLPGPHSAFPDSPGGARGWAPPGSSQAAGRDQKGRTPGVPGVRPDQPWLPLTC